MIVFSQFVQMLLLLEKECRQRHINTHILTGQTKDRQQVVNTFQADTKPGVFLLSLRAAGTGHRSYVMCGRTGCKFGRQPEIRGVKPNGRR